MKTAKADQATPETGNTTGDLDPNEEAPGRPQPPQSRSRTDGESSPSPDRKRRVRYWLAVRIVDYRLQALAPSDPDDPQGEQAWSDMGADSTFSSDREAVYQLAKSHDGLLMSAEGLPAAGRLKALYERIKASEGAPY